MRKIVTNANKTMTGLNTDITSVLQLLNNIKLVIDESNEKQLHGMTSDELGLLTQTLESPILRGAVTVQDSLHELNQELIRHPSILPVDFDITAPGELVLNVPTTLDVFESSAFQPRVLNHVELNGGNFHSAKRTVGKVAKSNEPREQIELIERVSDERSVEHTANSIHSLNSIHGVQSPTPSLVHTLASNAFANDGYERIGNARNSSGYESIGYDKRNDFRHERNDEQRVPCGQFSPTNPTMPSSFSNFSKLNHPVSTLPGVAPCELDISAPMQLSPNAPALNFSVILAKDESLPAEMAYSYDNRLTDLTSWDHNDLLAELSSARQTIASDSPKSGIDFLFDSEWAQIEAIELINDGTGLGFGIIGGRTMGVVVKTILAGGVADRDGRLRSGDYILQIGDVNLHEMGSEQVASVLRQSGTKVRLVVARSADHQVAVHVQTMTTCNSEPIYVPTRLLSNPVKLDLYLSQNGHTNVFAKRPPPPPPVPEMNCHSQADRSFADVVPGTFGMDLNEVEEFTIELKRDTKGLGITIAGYVCEQEELSGIFIKSVNPGSAADVSGRIQVNDRIVAVNGKSLQGFNNHEAVEVLRNSGNSVTLCLVRYLRGPKYDQLQQAIAANQREANQRTAAITSKQRDSRTSSFGSHDNLPPTRTQVQVTIENPPADKTITKHNLIIEFPLSQIERNALIAKWQNIVGDHVSIVIAELRKFGETGGLGISLEGTVDVEDGKEVRPHHYIRSILAEGPVGRDARLKSGDELLEVNGCRLLGRNHMEVVGILKELPINVRMICGRNVQSRTNSTAYDDDEHATSLVELTAPNDRLVKAKSDGSLSTIVAAADAKAFPKIRSRSLEPLTGLAMWSSEPQVIELVKGERGLGFSILDYQDPIDPNDTVIVIRSLVPGGVAQLDGRLIPGDRLLFVNDTRLEDASLDQAVQALKGAAKGIVRIGVAKPLPVPDTLMHSQIATTSGLSSALAKND